MGAAAGAGADRRGDVGDVRRVDDRVGTERPGHLQRGGCSTSTATTRAPSAFAIITADRPTPPQPCTATHWPADDLAVGDDRAVRRREPAAQGRRGHEGDGVGQADHVGVRARDGHPLRERPGQREARLRWSGQTWASPAPAVLAAAAPEHERHGHPVADRPAASRRGPTATTVPAYSCPGMWGSATGSCPRQACQSDRQTPVAATSTTTPSAGHDRVGDLDDGRQHARRGCRRRPSRAAA